MWGWYTTPRFISMSQSIHGNRYDYSKTTYTNARNRVIITCKIHGDFLQRPFLHLRGCGCMQCSHNKFTVKSFIEKASSVHMNRYNYSQTNYIDSKTLVRVLCPKHGAFKLLPKDHIRGKGCSKCGCAKCKCGSKCPKCGSKPCKCKGK